MSLPFYKPPTDKERAEQQAEMPYSRRKGLLSKAKPMDIGLWSDERNQLDLIDQLRQQERKAP
jgi:hypothetical protein